MSTRKCVEFELALEAAVECRRNLSAPMAGYESHLAECVDCQSRWQSARFLDESLAVWANAIPPIDLVASVLQFTTDKGQFLPEPTRPYSAADIPSNPSTVESQVIHCEQASTLTERAPATDNTSSAAGRPGPIAAYAVLAIVASVVLATGWLMIPHRSSEISDGAIARTGDPGPIAEAGVPRPNTKAPTPPTNLKTDSDEVEISGLFRDAGSAYRSLAEEAADRVRDVATLVVQSRNFTSVNTGNLRNELPQESRMIDESSTPWEKRLDRAFEFLMEAIPEAESPPS